jgi:hypothetical protein
MGTWENETMGQWDKVLFNHGNWKYHCGLDV